MTTPPTQDPQAARRRPGRPSRPADDPQHAEVRDRLLVAATELAVERGLDGAGIREIADRAGVSSGMISYYFGDRAGLEEAMSQRALTELASEFAKAIAERSRDSDLLDMLIHVHATALSANPWLPRLVARDVLGVDRDSRARISSQMGQGPMQLLRDTIQEAIDSGALRADLDPDMCVLTIASTGAFPYLMAPLLADHLDIEFDDDFRDRLIAHNRDLLANGLRTPAQREKLE